jgi:type IV secretory pathway VirB2 component (pilin)
MKKTSIKYLLLINLSACIALAQTSPWERAASNLELSFTGLLARSLLAVATVLTGMYFAFSEGQGKSKISGLVFGGAMMVSAVQWIAWLYS